MQAAQAYFACEKNEMMAANFLFENAESLRAEMEEEAPGAHPPGAPPARPPAPPVVAPAPMVPPPPPAEVKKEEKKAEPAPEKKEEGTINFLYDCVDSSLQLEPKPEEKKKE